MDLDFAAAGVFSSESGADRRSGLPNTFTLLLFGQLVPDGKLDHFHAEHGAEGLLRSVEHPPKCSTAVTQNCLCCQITPLSHLEFPSQDTFLLDAVPSYWCSSEIACHGISDKLLDQLAVCRLYLIPVFCILCILGFFFFVIIIAFWLVTALALSWSLFFLYVVGNLVKALALQ